MGAGGIDWYIKTERTQIHLLSDVLAVVASLELKALIVTARSATARILSYGNPSED